VADEPTCGQGLAEHSALPAKLGELIDAVAENLEVHLAALDPTDEATEPERAAYVELTRQHRDLAARLRTIGREMAGYRDLPMGRHDPSAMASPRVFAAFEAFVQREEELLALFHYRLAEDRQMLAAMSRPSEPIAP
jgi:hypothetical protein